VKSSVPEGLFDESLKVLVVLVLTVDREAIGPLTGEISNRRSWHGEYFPRVRHQPDVPSPSISLGHILARKASPRTFSFGDAALRSKWL
jgi:hypothetical protein